MRVLHIVQASPYGGAQKVVADLAREQRRLGVDAQVLSLYHNDIFFSQLQSGKVPYASTGGRSGSDPRTWAKMIVILRARKPDIICLHMTLFWSLLVLCLAIKEKVALVFHGHTYPPTRPTVKHRLVRFLLSRRLDAVIGVSRSVTDASQLYYGHRVKVFRTIYNGIDLNGYPIKVEKDRLNCMGETTPGHPLIGMATRFAEDKGVREFLESVPHILRRLPEARFVLAGDGPLLPWAQAYVAIRNLEDSIALPGFIQDMPAFWAGLDFALFTSPREAFGLRIIEPQSSGTVVIGYSNGSGSDEIIVSGKTGLLVSWGDSNSLAREMATLWADPERYRDMARAARERVHQHFFLARMARECLDLYKELNS